MKKVGLTIAAVLVLVLACAAIIGYRSQTNEVAYKPSEAHIYTPEELLVEANKLRAEKGVAPLKLDPRLNQSAQWKADDMAVNNYFGHVLNGYHGYQKIIEQAPDCTGVGENIEKQDISKNSSPFDWWVTSTPHYKAILNSENTTTGFGIRKNGSAVLYVEHFCHIK